MNQIEKLKKAKEYMHKLANGIDPLTNEGMPNDSILNNIRMSRCFFFVYEALGELESLQKYHPKSKLKESKVILSLNTESIRSVRLTAEPIVITEFARKVNLLIDNYRLRSTVITNWLVAKGYLETKGSGSKLIRIPTKSGIEIGISHVCNDEDKASRNYYDNHAQQFIIDHLYEIITE